MTIAFLAVDRIRITVPVVASDSADSHAAEFWLGPDMAQAR